MAVVCGGLVGERVVRMEMPATAWSFKDLQSR